MLITLEKSLMIFRINVLILTVVTVFIIDMINVLELIKILHILSYYQFAVSILQGNIFNLGN